AARIWTPGATYDVTGVGYDPAGHIEAEGARRRAADDPELAALLETALVCNHARLERVGADWRMVGEPTEGALVVLAYKGWTPEPDRNAVAAETPFSSERKRMSVVAGDRAGGHVMHLKGAPEVVFDLLAEAGGGANRRPFDDAARAEAEAAYSALAAEGLRVVAIARRRAAGPHDVEEAGLTLLGLVGIIDPPRPEVRAAVAGAKAAGVRVVMITGDSPVTAEAIARGLDLGVDRVIVGADLDEMDDQALDAALAGDVLFARTSPAHKLRIVGSLQRAGRIVAMTGDGVNDAPALKQADIGVAMGIRGTDVAKDSADIVLLDDNFATIVAAIREGRRQFDNVRKFVRYLLCSNAGEVVAITINLALGGPLIFLASQILWMNLVTDGATAVALGVERSEAGQMKRPPRRPQTPVVGRAGLAAVLAFGAYTGLACLWIFHHYMPQGETLARTAAFTAMVVFEKASVFAFRSLREPNWRIGWFSNPWLLVALTATMGLQVAAVYWPPLQTLLRTTPLALGDWGLILALAAPLVVGPELFKSVRGRARA
ncbi:MAG: HAD-IC family P-type ATPase, partial [Pseudomonadota bacterium]